MNEVSSPAQSSLEVLQPVARRYGVRCSLEEFHAAVNVVFHDMESEVYDRLHDDMWQSLPAQFNLVAGDIAAMLPEGKLRLLDIGSGTGLSSELLLRSPIGPRIGHLHLLDTSPRMLERAAARMAAHPVEVERTNGLTHAIAGRGRFDIILMCSVLHHVPDLEALGRDIARLQRPGGFFLHFQDPNADAGFSSRREQRMAELQRATRSLLPRPVERIWKALGARLRGNGAYLDRVNDALMARGVIQRPMPAPDIWAVTDIHIGSGQGISVQSLRQYLPAYQLVSHRTYAFFSQLESRLPNHLARKEAELAAEHSLEGFQLAAAWRHRG